MPHCCGSSGSFDRASFEVRGMTCDHCKMTVSGALKRLDGVSEVQVDLRSGKVSVSYDPARVGVEAMKKAVSEAGYSVS